VSDESLRELGRAAAKGDQASITRYRSALSRLAAMGNDYAARELLLDIEGRNLARDFPLDPSTLLVDLHEDDFGGQYQRVMRALRGTIRPEPNHAIEIDVRALTLRGLATLRAGDLATLPGVGEKSLAALSSLLARAGLDFKPEVDPERAAEIEANTLACLAARREPIGGCRYCHGFGSIAISPAVVSPGSSRAAYIDSTSVILEECILCDASGDLRPDLGEAPRDVEATDARR
jgi:hypothetical protein